MEKIALVFLALIILITGQIARAESRPNIVLILADDLGYSDLGCYGGEIKTPHLDALAAGGLRMTQLYNTSRCCSTRASLLTGLYPHQAGIGAMTADNGLPGYRGFLTDRCVTIPTVLQKAGYQTFMSGKWHLRGKGNPDCTPINRGFSEFFGHFKAYASFFRKELFIRLPEDRPKPQYGDDFYATNAITDYGLKFIEQARENEKPYFLYLSYNAPHFPLHAPEEMIDSYVFTYEKGWDAIREERYKRMLANGIIDKKFKLSPRGHVPKIPNRNRDSPYFDKQIPAWNSLPADRRADLTRRMATYAAMVEILDRNVGRVVADLRKNGELEETLIIFLSDNGACAEWDPFGFDNNPYPKNKLYTGDQLAEMGQKGSFHSYGTGWANACNTPFRLYKHYNHEGGISSPFILHWPAKMKRTGEIDHQPAHLIDLAAMIYEIGGGDYPGPPTLPLPGTNLMPVLEGKKLPARPIFFEHEGNRAVRVGKWKLVWTNFEKSWELYNIEEDRSEMNDVATENTSLVGNMGALWENWASKNFVEPQQVKQPATGMPKIYYLSE